MNIAELIEYLEEIKEKEGKDTLCFLMNTVSAIGPLTINDLGVESAGRLRDECGFTSRYLEGLPRSTKAFIIYEG